MGNLVIVLIPAVATCIWAGYTIFVLQRQRNADVVTLRSLIKYQAHAIAGSHSPEGRIWNFVDILGKRRNTMTVLFYKYLVSHSDLTNIIAHISVDEYNKAARICGRAVRTIWGMVPVIFLLCAGGVLFAHFEMERYELITAMCVMGFFVASVVLLFVYSSSVHKYKAGLLNQLAKDADEFFDVIPEERYEKFVEMVGKVLAPNKWLQSRIKHAIEKDL